jgi:hypothetical protein
MTLLWDLKVLMIQISFILNLILLFPHQPSLQGNVFRYSVYVNTVNAPANVILEAKQL